MAAAVRTVMLAAQPPNGVEAEGLYATLRAWQDHFPESFKRDLGTQGTEFIAQLSGAAADRNRYLKLRRLALAHLAHTL